MIKIDTPSYKQQFAYHNDRLLVLSSHLLSNGLKLEPHQTANVNDNIFALMSIDDELKSLRNLLDNYQLMLTDYERDCNELTGRNNTKK